MGEAESILLAQEMNAEIILIDEKKGRRIAKELGFNVIGLVGILIQAKKMGLISELKPELTKLTSLLEFRMSKQLIEFALNEVGEN